MKARAYTFTLNNYTDEDIDFFTKLDCKYIVYGKEKAPTTGTPHLQGYVYFANPRSFESVRKLRTWHLSIARGSPDQNFNYCSKDGEVYERGEKPKDPSAQGQTERDRWSEAYKAAEEGRLDDISGDIKLKCSAGIRFAMEQGKRKRSRPDCIIDDEESMREWQSVLFKEIQGAPDRRKIIWYVDKKGGQGKSEFTRYLMSKDQSVFVSSGGKSNDIAYQLDSPKIVVFDFCRTMEDHVNYNIIEQVKNGVVTCNKYEGGTKAFPIPHVIVFSNFDPIKTKLSLDRWDIREL